MPKRLGTTFFGYCEKTLEEVCKNKLLNSYETEVIIRIYARGQNLNYIADTMEFDGHGKAQIYYSVRTINTIHKQAYEKLMK